MGYYAVKRYCDQYQIKNYTINIDDSVDVDGDVYLSSKLLGKIPIKFNRVSGSFTISNNRLESLENVPQFVGENFNAAFCGLTSLEHSPEYVGGNFRISFNEIKSFQGAPKSVGGILDVSNNFISDFSECPISPKITMLNNHTQMNRQDAYTLFDIGYTLDSIEIGNYDSNLIVFNRQYILRNLIK